MLICLSLSISFHICVLCRSIPISVCLSVCFFLFHKLVYLFLFLWFSRSLSTFPLFHFFPLCLSLILCFYPFSSPQNLFLLTFLINTFFAECFLRLSITIFHPYPYPIFNGLRTAPPSNPTRVFLPSGNVVFENGQCLINLTAKQSRDQGR